LHETNLYRRFSGTPLCRIDKHYLRRENEDKGSAAELMNVIRGERLWRGGTGQVVETNALAEPQRKWGGNLFDLPTRQSRIF